MVLIDLQRDFLGDPRLEPSAGHVIEQAARLLAAARAAGAAVIHVHTVIGAETERMPHWKAANLHICMRGTAGARPPPALQPQAHEVVIHKSTFSAFTNPAMVQALRAHGVTKLILAGVHLHGCVRCTALDAYQLGFEVFIAESAVGSYDPLHGEQTRLYLEGRAARFIDDAETARYLAAASAPPPAGTAPARAITLVEPACRLRILGVESVAGDAEINRAAGAALAARDGWARVTRQARAELLRTVALRLEQQADEIATQLTRDVGKPRAAAAAEVAFACQLVREALEEQVAAPDRCSVDDPVVYQRPHGVVALVTPSDHPLSVPLAKVTPALLAGNSVLWKPAPAASLVAKRLCGLLYECGLPTGVVELVPGNRAVAESLLGLDAVQAAAVTGDSLTCYAAQAICARRRIPLEVEFAGNNAAIALPDARVSQVAHAIAESAMTCAGQRRSAIRRVIVPAIGVEEWVEALCGAVAALQWGDPGDEGTIIGPLISDAACETIADVLRRAQAAGATLLQTHSQDQFAELRGRGSYHPPAIVVSDDPGSEIVQHATFGPVLVVEPACDWEHALTLLDGVRQQHIAALFTTSTDRQRDFFDRCRAAILQINGASAAVAGEPPLPGGRFAPGAAIGQRDESCFFWRSQRVCASGHRPGRVPAGEQ